MAKPEKSTRSFETQIDLAAPRDAVWNAIANDSELQRWFAPKAEIDAQVGGEIVWDWGRHHRWVQRIEILEPGKRLRTRYDSEVDDGEGGKKPLFIDFLLEGDGGTTSLRLVQSGFGSEAGFDAEYDGISQGWDVELRSLRLYLEQHLGRERQLVWNVADVALPPAEVWERLTSTDAFACGADLGAKAEGDEFHFVSVDGDEFSGTALTCYPHEFTGMARTHGNAFLRISVNTWADMTHVWCWLGAYDRPNEEIAALQTRWDAMLGRVFPDRVETRSDGAVSS